jgi:hypothetical protein
MKLKKVLPILAMLLVEEMAWDWNRLRPFLNAKLQQRNRNLNRIKTSKEADKMESLFSISLN